MTLQILIIFLASLLLAIGIWGVVRPSHEDPTAPTNPLAVSESREFTNLPVFVVSAAADVREFKVNPNAVQVTLRGDPKIMKALEEKEIEVLVNLKGIGFLGMLDHRRRRRLCLGVAFRIAAAGKQQARAGEEGSPPETQVSHGITSRPTASFN